MAKRTSKKTLAVRNKRARELGFKNYYQQRKAKGQRTSKREYERRKELAKERGFKSPAQERKARKIAKGSRGWRDAQMPKAVPGTSEVDRMLALYYEAFYGSPNDYSMDGAKARWFVEIAQIMDYDEWGARYPNGIREYGGSRAA
jgi:hypothetical protein